MGFKQGEVTDELPRIYPRLQKVLYIAFDMLFAD